MMTISKFVENNQRQLLNILIVISGFLLLIGRKPGGITAPFLWAEDGKIFLEQLLNTGPNWLTPYAGQYWILERGLYVIAELFPLQLIPQISYVISTAAITALMAVVLQERNQTIFRKHSNQIITFYLLVSIPGVFEATNGIISVYLWLPVSLCLVLASPKAKTWWGATSEYVLVVVASFTSLTAIFVLPVAIWSFLKQRSWQNGTRLGILIIGAVTAVISIKQSGRPTNIPGSFFEVLVVALRKVFGVLFFGHSNIIFFWPAGEIGPFFFLSLFSLAVIAIIAVSLRKGPLLSFLIVAGISSFLGILASASLELLIADPVSGGRYFVPAIGVVIVTLMVGVSSSKIMLKIPSLLLLASFTFGFASDFQILTPTPLEASTWNEFVDCVDAQNSYCHINIAPAAPWGVTVGGQ